MASTHPGRRSWKNHHDAYRPTGKGGQTPWGTHRPRTLHVTFPGLRGPCKRPNSWGKGCPMPSPAQVRPALPSAAHDKTGQQDMAWTPDLLKGSESAPLFSSQRPSLGIRDLLARRWGRCRGDSRVMVFQHERRPTKTAFSSLQGQWFGSHSVRKKPTNQCDCWTAGLREVSREKSRGGENAQQAPRFLGALGNRPLSRALRPQAPRKNVHDPDGRAGVRAQASHGLGKTASV